MAFDRSALVDTCQKHGAVARVVVAEIRGSAPREVGAAMLVWADGQAGTIGGGTLEHELTLAARAALPDGRDRLTSHALGPDMGQCCGGNVRMLTEIYSPKRAESLAIDIIARGSGPEPLAVHRIAARMRAQGIAPEPKLVDGWMVEPVQCDARPIWIWGAGHVGRALVDVLHPLPGVAVTWVDTNVERYPARIPENVTQLAARHPVATVAYAPPDAEHLIVTYSHSIDLALCHALLEHGFSFAGLIGSATKWARFRSRLRGLGHSAAQIQRITCPIGMPELGKHPKVIAIGVAARILARNTVCENAKEHLA